MKRKFILLFIILTLAYNIGCSTDKTEPYREVFKKYNNLLPRALKSSNAELVAPITSKREKGSVEIFISQLDLKNQYMESKLEYLKFLEGC